MELLEKFLEQVGLVQSVWMPFVVMVALAAVAIWKAMDWRYGGIIERLRDEVRHLEHLYARIQPPPSQSPSRPAPTAPMKEAPNASEKESAPPKPVEEERVFLDPTVTAEFLSELRRGRTTIQADHATEMYLGKWMKVSGTVFEVTPAYKTSEGAPVVSVGLLPDLSKPIREQVATSVTLFFSKDIKRLEVLSKGSPITAAGRLETINLFGLQLIDCELIDPA